MKKYVVTIEETVVEDFPIFAMNPEEARKEAERRYDCAEIVLCPGEVQYKQMAVYDGDKKVMDWEEF